MPSNERAALGNTGATLGNTGAALGADELIRLMAETDRRRVVAALILAAGDRASIAERTGLDIRQVAGALDRLTSAGLVEEGSDGTFVVLETVFKTAARVSAENLGHNPVASTAEDSSGVPALSGDLVDGRLERLPRKRSKRLLVLDRLAQEFEPGTHYSERQVNHKLRAFNDDVATLRRYLVDEGFLDRADGAYWRSGGTVATPD